MTSTALTYTDLEQTARAGRRGLAGTPIEHDAIDRVALDRGGIALSLDENQVGKLYPDGTVVVVLGAMMKDSRLAAAAQRILEDNRLPWRVSDDPQPELGGRTTWSLLSRDGLWRRLPIGFREAFTFAPDGSIEIVVNATSLEHRGAIDASWERVTAPWERTDHPWDAPRES